MIEEITAIVTAIATSLTAILLIFQERKDFLEKCEKEIKDIKKLILFFEENKEKIHEIGRYYYTSFSKLCNEIVHAYKNEIELILKEKIKANKLEIIKRNLKYDLEAYEKEYYERVILKPYLICKVGNFYYPLYCFFTSEETINNIFQLSIFLAPEHAQWENEFERFEIEAVLKEKMKKYLLEKVLKDENFYQIKNIIKKLNEEFEHFEVLFSKKFAFML
jgi:hypothetical protein